MNQLDDIFKALHAETERSLTDLAKSRDLNDRQIHSEVVRNLCEAMRALGAPKSDSTCVKSTDAAGATE